MTKIELEINTTFKLGLYLQMMASFCKEISISEINQLNQEFNELIKSNHTKDIEEKLPLFKHDLERLATRTILRYKPKKSFNLLIKNWSELTNKNPKIFERGVMYGWLEKQIELSNYLTYDYVPYHFRIGLNFNKGKGDIEENFLLKDSFNCLNKAKLQFDLLVKHNNTWKDEFGKIDRSNQKVKFIKELNLIKQEISFYCRMTILSFFSFLESFINSIGYDYYYRNKEILSLKEIEILKGSKKGNYLNIKQKIEKFQNIIRNDKKVKIRLTDKNQIKEPFLSLFNDYEKLRNSAVHFSPDKSRIWLEIDTWLEKAEYFSKITIEASLIIWKTFHNTNKGPDYLGRLEYERLLSLTKGNLKEINKIQKSHD